MLIKLPSKEANSRTEANKLLGSIAKSYAVEKEWLGSAGKALTDAKIDSSLRHIKTREYTVNCNWKVGQRWRQFETLDPSRPLRAVHFNLKASAFFYPGT